jgi:hypothetical protein
MIWSSNIGFVRIKSLPRPGWISHWSIYCYELNITRGLKALSLHRALRVVRKHKTNKLKSLDSDSSVPWSLFRAGSVAHMGYVGSFHLRSSNHVCWCTGKTHCFSQNWLLSHAAIVAGWLLQGLYARLDSLVPLCMKLGHSRKEKMCYSGSTC